MYNKIKSEEGVYDRMIIKEEYRDIRESKSSLESNEVEITEDDSWEVINSYFEEHGLVSQQIASFNDFIKTKIGSITKEARCVEYVDVLGPHIGGRNRYIVEFGEPGILPWPVHDEDNTREPVTPHQARTRNLTYESELMLQCKLKVIQEDREGNEKTIYDKNSYDYIKLGKIPIMVRSRYCALYDLTDNEKVHNGECLYDQGGYFIIQGSEKVLVAQEKMADNFVYVFKAKVISKHSWVAEIRSTIEGSNDPPRTFKVKLVSKPGESQEKIECDVSYVNAPIPLVILFRALGYDSDQEIFQFICHNIQNKLNDMEDVGIYNKPDEQMMELLKGSFEGAEGGYRSQEICLEYIGNKFNKNELKYHNLSL